MNATKMIIILVREAARKKRQFGNAIIRRSNYILIPANCSERAVFLPAILVFYINSNFNTVGKSLFCQDITDMMLDRPETYPELSRNFFIA